MDEALKYGGLTTLSDSYAINGQPGDFYECSNGTKCKNITPYIYIYMMCPACLHALFDQQPKP